MLVALLDRDHGAASRQRTDLSQRLPCFSTFAPSVGGLIALGLGARHDLKRRGQMFPNVSKATEASSVGAYREAIGALDVRAFLPRLYLWKLGGL